MLAARSSVRWQDWSCWRRHCSPASPCSGKTGLSRDLARRSSADRQRQVGQVRLRHRLRPGTALRQGQGRQGAAGARSGPTPAEPFNLRASTDLMLLHPDGSEEVLVAGGKGAIADPYVSFDAQWVYYAYFHDISGHGGADIYKVHVKTRKIVRLTQQQCTPNTGVAATGGEGGVQGGRLQPPPLPAAGRPGRLRQQPRRLQTPRGYPQRPCNCSSWTTTATTSRRSATSTSARPCTRSSSRTAGSSSARSNRRACATASAGASGASIPTAPTGTRSSAPCRCGGAAMPFHFQTQLSDGSIVVENYYNQTMGGFGTYFKLPPRPPAGTPAFGPAKYRENDPKMYMTGASSVRMPFQPYGMEVLTRFTHDHDSPSLRADPEGPEVAAHRQGHAPLRRAGQSPAHGLDRHDARQPGADHRRLPTTRWTPAST